jgi:Putative zinc-finger
VTSPYTGQPAEAAAPAGHAGSSLLADYAAGTAGAVAAWSVETHLAGCGRCRQELSAYADPDRLARNRSAVLVRSALPESRAGRVLRRSGVPDHVLRLLAATPSLRASWLLAVVGVLAVVTVETGFVEQAGPGGPPGLRGLMPFLLVAPLLILASVAAAFAPALDPAHRLAVAAPCSGLTLLLARAVSALAVALIPVICAAFFVPGPPWLPAALLLPSLALCATALAAATVVGPVAAAAGSAVLWALPVVALAATHLPLAVVQWHAQYACAVVLLVAAAVLLVRRDRFEFGWNR